MAKMAFREMPSYLTSKTLKQGGVNARRQALAGFVLKTIKQHEDHGIERVTSRQLYYRIVAANVVPNSDKSYKMVTSLLADMRYWGLVDWDFVVDLGREPIIPTEYADINALARAAVYSLKYDRWEGQPYHVEVWVEKQALQSVLEPIGRDLHVPIVVNKGYSSASAMFTAAQRLRNAKKEKKRKPIVLYFGDLDPSGEDMVRDVRDRLAEFGATPTIEKIALKLDQVLEHACPPNPAKTSDIRYEGYAAAMNDSDEYASVCEAQGLSASEMYSWELDSLPVDALSTLVRESVEEYIEDPDAVEAVKEREENDKKALRKAAKAIAKGDFNAGDDDDDEEEEDDE